MEESQIQKFYKGTNVFITGGTGFMGKIIIEKLLRDTEVETIYVLIREKKGKSADMRIDDLLDDEVFDRVKRERPKYRNKVEAIAGDCAFAGLGISITDRQKLISNIHIVFHVAATVNFTEHLQLAFTINVNGTKHLLFLAREMKNLKSLVHVSTAYSNCPQSQIDEKIYDYPIRCSDVEAVLDKLSVNEADILTPNIMGKWPNTYTFTKALAELTVRESAVGLPVGIFRPSIIVSTYKEPLPGWIDNLYGPTGIVAGAVSGILRVLICDPQKRADIVPIDTCVAGLLASAWDIAEKPEERKADNIPVYNYVSSPENPMLWEEFIELNHIHGCKYTSLNALWCPYIISVTSIYLFTILKILLHLFPAALLDLVAIISGKKPRLLHMYKKIHKFSEAIGYFATREWDFSNKNTQNVWKKMNKTDQELFPMRITTVSWLLFFREYIKGVRKYMLHEPDSTLTASRAKFKKFKLAHRVLTFFIIGATTSFITSTIFRVYSILFH